MKPAWCPGSAPSAHCLVEALNEIFSFAFACGYGCAVHDTVDEQTFSTLADLASSETAAELCLWTVKTEICCMWLPGEGRKRGPHDVDEPRPKHS